MGRSGFWRVVHVLVCSVALAPAAAAQQAVNSATLSGRVVDPQGAAVPGAQVVARQKDTNIVSERTTDREGRFRFPYLRIGTYEIGVRLDGFRPYSRTLTLMAGSAFDLSIPLQVADVTANVTVTAEPPVVDTARTQIAGTVSRGEIAAVPLNGRNFLDVALLVPGVAPPNVGSTQLFAETSAVPGAGLSVASQRNFSNNFIVDGLSDNDDAAGLSGIPVGVDAIDQFQVVTSGGQAELGRALGGYVNVVTKSGSNQLHGDAYEYFRHDRLNAANALLGQTLPMRQHQYGGSLGGPLVRDRTFYFANIERRDLRQTGLTTISGDAVQAIDTRLVAAAYPGSTVTTGMYANPVDTLNVLAKVDHQAGSAGLFSFRYMQYNATASHARGAGGLSAPSASAGLDDIDRAMSFSHTASLSGRTANELRAQIVSSNLKALPEDTVGPAVGIAGVASFGTLSTSPTGRRNTLVQAVDNLSHQAGPHALRAGLDFLYNDDTIAFPRADRGSYMFSSLANFLAGVYNNAGFTQTFGASAVSQTNPNVGFYLQDEWKAGANLTVNAGVRCDLQFLQTIRTDTNNVSPRAGIAWTPTRSKRTVVRGSAGLFYDRVPLRAPANALLSADNTDDVSRLRQINISLSPGQGGAPVFPAILAAPVPSVTLPSLTTMSRTMQNAYSRQASVEVEQQIGNSSTLSIGYQYTHGLNLIASVNQNVPACVAVGGNNGCRPNPAYGNNSQYSPVGMSAYHGMFVSFAQRPAAWGYYRVAYTLSKAMDDVGEFFFSAPIDPFDISKDWGRSDDDQRHRVVVNGALNSPAGPGRSVWERLTHGFQIGATLQYSSALPLNITSGLTTVQGTTARPVVDGAFIARNAGTGPDLFSLDARITRSFPIGGRARIDAVAEAFNLTNRANAVTMNGNFGPGIYPTSPAPGFGAITAVGDPRTVQLAVRVNF